MLMIGLLVLQAPIGKASATGRGISSLRSLKQSDDVPNSVDLDSETSVIEEEDDTVVDFVLEEEEDFDDVPGMLEDEFLFKGEESEMEEMGCATGTIESFCSRDGAVYDCGSFSYRDCTSRGGYWCCLGEVFDEPGDDGPPEEEVNVDAPPAEEVGDGVDESNIINGEMREDFSPSGPQRLAAPDSFEPQPEPGDQQDITPASETQEDEPPSPELDTNVAVVMNIYDYIEVDVCPDDQQLQALAESRCAALEAQGNEIIRCQAACGCPSGVYCTASVNQVIYDISVVRATEDPMTNRADDDEQQGSLLDDVVLNDLIQNESGEPTDTARSLGVASLDIPAAPPLPPPPPYDPEVSPQVKVQVGAQLPGDVPCDDLSGDQLEDLAVSYCLKILELAGLGDLFFAGQCSASCGVSSNSRKMLQVNPVLFDIDFVRANEDPAAVDAANGEAQELESILEDDSLLSTALEQTLPGTTVTSQEVSASLAEPSEGTGGGQEGIPAQGAPPAAASNQTSTETPNARNNSNCTDIPTPDEYTCEQQKVWGKCTAGFMLKGDFCAKTCGRCGGTGEYCTNLPTPDGYTCEQQKGWGKCTADFMLQGGFCAKTCGRC